MSRSPTGAESRVHGVDGDVVARRAFCGGLLACVATSGRAGGRASAASTTAAALAALEVRHGGRLGAAILDAVDGSFVSHRGRERFPMCSVGKLPAVACVLGRVDRGRMSLADVVRYGPRDLIPHSPATSRSVAAGMSVRALCAASIELSDNAAHNLLVRRLGGPSAVTEFVRSLGDGVSRFDRLEPELNHVGVGDERDTTSPLAMARLVGSLLFGDALSAASSAALRSWMATARTGASRLRADVPSSWSAGDKTGTGPRNAVNDVAFLAAPGRLPLIVSAFLVDSQAALGTREAVLAAVGRAAVAGSR